MFRLGLRAPQLSICSLILLIGKYERQTYLVFGGLRFEDRDEDLFI